MSSTKPVNNADGTAQGAGDEPIVDLDHDHDDLTALLTDLTAFVQQASVDATRHRALREARDLMRYFQADMAHHFEHEEGDLFPILEQYLPEQQTTITSLKRAHKTFSNQFAEIAALLNPDDVSYDTLRECLAKIAKLVDSFTGHSQIESKLVRALDAKVVDPATRAELREKLAHV